VGALSYYRDVVRLAFSHSIERAHALIFLAILAAGIAAYLVPGLHLNMEGPEITAVALGTIVALRLVMAPYWLHQEQEKRIPKIRPEWQRSNTRVPIARSYIAAESKWCLGFDDWPVSGEAREVLEQTIFNGEIDVWGKKKPEDVVFLKISVDYWKDYRIVYNLNDTVDTDHRAFRKPQDQIQYYDLHVDREDILRCWPRATNRELRRHSSKMT